ncbi:hypothetical protein D3C74_399400 [compost metagenome]
MVISNLSIFSELINKCLIYFPSVPSIFIYVVLRHCYKIVFNINIKPNVTSYISKQLFPIYKPSGFR